MDQHLKWLERNMNYEFLFVDFETFFSNAIQVWTVYSIQMFAHWQRMNEFGGKSASVSQIFHSIYYLKTIYLLSS